MTLSHISLIRLATCHTDLQKLVKSVAEELDIMVICGHRNEEQQNEAFQNKKSKLKWPRSKHNAFPSHAVDVAILDSDKKISWENTAKWNHMVTVFKKHSQKLGIPIECGGEWRMRDWPHIQLAFPGLNAVK